MTDYRHIPRECQTGTCDHTPGHCIRYRSPRCLSGECSHAADGLACGITLMAVDTADTIADATTAPVVQLPPPAEFPPRCARPDCTGTPVDHVGWMLGHMFQAAPPQAEEQPSQADATARAHAAAAASLVASQQALAETIANPPQPAEEQPHGADATADPFATMASLQLDPRDPEDGPPVVGPLTGFEIFATARWGSSPEELAEEQPHGADATADFRPAGYLEAIRAEHGRTAGTSGHGPEDYPDDPEEFAPRSPRCTHLHDEECPECAG